MGKRIQKVSLNNLESRVLNLGYVGEHEHTRIEIDCTDVLWDYPNAECSMVVQPPTGDMYPLTPVREENSIIWLVTDSDVVYNGTGRVQITFTNDGEIVKSAIANTRIDQSIMATGPVPTPLENWMEQAEETARQMAQDAADATVEDLAEEKEAAIADIQTQEAETEEAIAQAAADARASIPADYTQLSDDVTDLKSAYEQLNDNVIVDSAGPAPIVSIADGADGMPMRKVEVAIEPVQDLHGYDAPWPAGGGANQWNEDWEAYGTSQIRSKTRVPVTAGATYFWCGTIVTAYEFENLTDSSIGNMTIQPNSQVTIPSGVNYLMIYSATGYGTTYQNNWALNYPATVTTYSPYSNICPISGWTGAKVTRTGKNLFLATKNNEDYTSLSSDGVYTLHTVSSTNVSFALGTASLKAGHSYILNGGANNSFRVVITYNGVSYLSGTGDSAVINLDSDATVNVVCVITTFATVNMQIKPMLRLASESDSTFEPYKQIQTYEVTFPSDPGTVYGGTLDVTTGVLTVDRAIVTFNGTQSVGFTAGNTANRIVWNDYQNIGVADVNFTSDTLASSTRSSSIKGDPWLIYNGNSVPRMFMTVPTTITSVSDFNAYVALHPISVVYHLAVPQKITLTPTEIKTLIGVNHLWSDAGNTAITYPADTKLYIDRKITEVVANALNA